MLQQSSAYGKGGADGINQNQGINRGPGAGTDFNRYGGGGGLGGVGVLMRAKGETRWGA